MSDALYNPSPEQIRAECARIRREWDAYTENERRAIKQRPPSIPGEVRGSVVCTDRPSE